VTYVPTSRISRLHRRGVFGVPQQSDSRANLPGHQSQNLAGFVPFWKQNPLRAYSYQPFSWTNGRRRMVASQRTSNNVTMQIHAGPVCTASHIHDIRRQGKHLNDLCLACGRRHQSQPLIALDDRYSLLFCIVTPGHERSVTCSPKRSLKGLVRSESGRPLRPAHTDRNMIAVSPWIHSAPDNLAASYPATVTQKSCPLFSRRPFRQINL